MTASSAANFIPDFTASFALAQADSSTFVKALSPNEKLEQAYQQGLSHGQTETRTHYEKELADQEEQINLRLQQAKSEWEAEFADRFVSELTAGLQAVKDDIADGVAMVLRRYIDEQIQSQILDDLTSTLDTILRDETISTLEITGPSHLLDLIKERLLDSVTSIVWNESDVSEVQIKVDNTLLETRIGDWLARAGEMT